MNRRQIVSVLVLLFAPLAVAAQVAPFTALDSAVVAQVAAQMRVAFGNVDVRLAGISGSDLDRTSGTASLWQYVYTRDSGDGGLRFVSVMPDADSLIFLISDEFALPFTLPAIDTTLRYANSDSMVARLATDTAYRDLFARFPETRIQFASYDGFPREDFLPPGFAGNEAFWKVQMTRNGDSTMSCFVHPETGVTHCRSILDTAASFHVETSAGNEVEFFATNFGVFGSSVFSGSPSFIYPRGSGRYYLAGAGFWFAAQVPELDEMQTKVILSFDPSTGAPWMTPGVSREHVPDAELARLYTSAAYDRSTGLPIRSELDPVWPLRLPGAETSATIMRPGTYVHGEEGRSGRPAFVDGTEQLVTQYRDDDPTNFTLQTDPIGLQVEEHIFAPDTGAYRGSVIVQYRIINKSGGPLVNCTVAGVLDQDLGLPENDAVRHYSARPALRTAIATTGPEEIEGYGTLAVTQLEAPMTTDGYVDNTRRSEYMRAGRLGTFRAWSIETDPSSVSEFFTFMSDGTIDSAMTGFDSRMLLASRTFNMRAGDTAYYAIGYSVVDRPSVADGDEAFESHILGLIGMYYGDNPLHVAAGTTVRGARASVSPNPTSGATRLRFALDATASAHVHVVDALGRRGDARSLGTLAAGTHDVALDLSAYPPGVYSIVVTAGGARTITTKLVVR